MKKLLCILLVLCLLSGNVVSAYADGTGRRLSTGAAKAPSPEAIKNAVDVFTKALTESSKGAGELAELSAFLKK